MSDTELTDFEQAGLEEAEELIQDMQPTWDREYKNLKAEREARERMPGEQDEQ
jgi:hypothetical protein